MRSILVAREVGYVEPYSNGGDGNASAASAVLF
jgi:hypothetical protein